MLLEGRHCSRARHYGYLGPFFMELSRAFGIYSGPVRLVPLALLTVANVYTLLTGLMGQVIPGSWWTIRAT